MENIIEMLNIRKGIPGVIANDDITLELRRGEIHALLGENGAGKSTLMSILFGMYQPDGGEIRIEGKTVKIKNPNPRLAAAIISQYGGPDGELGASLRYLSQRYSMPYPELKGLLTDIGTEELGHLEMVGTIVHQLTRNLTEEQIKEAGFEAYFVDHTTGVFPQFASGYPWSASTMQVTGDTIADLTEDLAAEQKARVTYDNILRLSDDPDVSDVIKFLRAREIVHFQRFGEGLRLAKDRLDEKNVYYVNPSFDQ